MQKTKQIVTGSFLERKDMLRFFYKILEEKEYMPLQNLQNTEKEQVKQAFNPFLPSYEYIPDGEPYIFDDRVYIYGSHDRFNGLLFCLNDYVCYSASVDNLSDWRYEGIIYRKKQDIKNKLGWHIYFAPDVVKGIDGKFYLYYTLDFSGIMGVAVCDTPAGGYEFYGYVQHKDGTIWGRKRGDDFPFDPGVFVDDDQRIYLYSGFYTSIPSLFTGFKKLKSRGGVALELESDMLTIKVEPELLFPKEGKRAFLNHEFFEASSIRKINDTYYFIYSSKHNHELCYAISDSPMGDFSFQGTLISIGDIFLDGITKENAARNYLGNTHGSIINIKNSWYVFYHRHTNRHSYSRQACAEQLQRDESGKFLQSEITSCGLNEGALTAEGIYEARIACNLWSKEGTRRYDITFPRIKLKKHPYFTQEGRDKDYISSQYIANMQHMAVAGFKYFKGSDFKTIRISVRGKAKGRMVIGIDCRCLHTIAEISIEAKDKMQWVCFAAESILPLDYKKDKYVLYFRFEGSGYIDFKKFEFV